MVYYHHAAAIPNILLLHIVYSSLYYTISQFISYFLVTLSDHSYIWCYFISDLSDLHQFLGRQYIMYQLDLIFLYI